MSINGHHQSNGNGNGNGASTVFETLLEERTEDRAPRSPRLRRKKSAGVPEPVPPASLSTGVERLDALLAGGLPQGSATLLFGPPFTGKGLLQARFFLAGLQAGQPSIFVLTDASATDMTRILTQNDPEFPTYIKQGLVHYVDLYTRLIGEDENHANTHYLEDPQAWEVVLQLIERVHKNIRKDYDGPTRLVLQSISTLMVELGGTATFRFLRALIGRFSRRGGTTMVAMESGMHPVHDVETVKHLCSGMISFRESNDQHVLRVEGLPTAFQPGWVEYDFDQRHFELTGSFASGRIRGARPALA